MIADVLACLKAASDIGQVSGIGHTYRRSKERGESFRSSRVSEACDRARDGLFPGA